MAIAAGARGVGVGSAINQLDNEVAMVAAVRSLVEAWRRLALEAFTSNSL
jgi:DhnA family fructose-bisphosphate aldolase class Ia